MIERLTNCPSCGGTLNEAGRCEFCGSKVFDFLTISFDRREMPSAKTYIRLKVGNQVVIAPVVINTARIDIRPNSMLECVNLMEGTRYIPAPCYPEINLDLMVIGDMIKIDEKGDND